MVQKNSDVFRRYESQYGYSVAVVVSGRSENVYSLTQSPQFISSPAFDVFSSALDKFNFVVDDLYASSPILNNPSQQDINDETSYYLDLANV